jgi:dTDP-4-amino-4,6-dideoxygalactose transaminase
MSGRTTPEPDPRSCPVRFQRPTLPSLLRAQRYWQAAESSRWFSNDGQLVRRFGSELTLFVGDNVHAVPVSNATMGLLLALRALTQAPAGHSVVLPSYTFAATGTVVKWAGYEPLFVDVDRDHWHADPSSMRSLLEQRADVVALMPCSTYGSAPPAEVVRQWEQLSHEWGVPLLIDSAAGFGSADAEGRRLGRNGDAEVFSFHATKPFAIGEGGAVLTRREEIAHRVRRLANFGFDPDRIVRNTPGLNAKMDELHAAMGLVVLESFTDVLARRKSYADFLIGSFSGEQFTFQSEADHASRQFLPTLCRSAQVRDELLENARLQGIELRTYFSEPLHDMPAFSGAKHTPVPLPVTEELAARIACLPVYSDMDQAVLDRVASLVG